MPKLLQAAVLSEHRGDKRVSECRDETSGSHDVNKMFHKWERPV